MAATCVLYWLQASESLKDRSAAASSGRWRPHIKDCPATNCKTNFVEQLHGPGCLLPKVLAHGGTHQCLAWQPASWQSPASNLLQVWTRRHGQCPGNVAANSCCLGGIPRMASPSCPVTWAPPAVAVAITAGPAMLWGRCCLLLTAPPLCGVQPAAPQTLQPANCCRCAEGCC